MGPPPGQGPAWRQHDDEAVRAVQRCDRRLSQASAGEIAQQHLERSTGWARAVHFAWAGFPERGKPHYYRVQGPSFLVEFENAQVGAGLPGEGNHIHTVWRDPDNDFGDDLLLTHYAQDHLPYVVSRLQSSKPRV